jgi:hypothetical protein
MLKILSIILLTSLSISIAVILNAWLLLPVIACLYFLSKKLLAAEKTSTSTTHPAVRFGFLLTASIFFTYILSGFFLFLLFIAFLLGFEDTKKCKPPIEIANTIPCGIFWGNDEFRRNTTKIANAILPQTNIKVRLFDGSIRPAKLTRSAVVNVENIKPDDVFLLNCTVNSSNVLDHHIYGNGFASCGLILPKSQPESTNYPEGLDARFGWSFGANIQGITDPQTLILSQPLIWPPNNATPINKYK